LRRIRVRHRHGTSDRLLVAGLSAADPARGGTERDGVHVMTTITPPLADTLAAELREMANDATIFAGAMFRLSQLHTNVNFHGQDVTYCMHCGLDWPCPFRQVYDYAERLAAKAHDAASELQRLTTVERERDALRRMARQLIDVTGAKGFRWYVDGPAELGGVVARAGAIIGYTPWKHPAAQPAAETDKETPSGHPC
jgi:hypothetical protein